MLDLTESRPEIAQKDFLAVLVAADRFTRHVYAHPRSAFIADGSPIAIQRRSILL
jgi:hypothetical protein